MSDLSQRREGKTIVGAVVTMYSWERVWKGLRGAGREMPSHNMLQRFTAAAGSQGTEPTYMAPTRANLSPGSSAKAGVIFISPPLLPSATIRRAKKRNAIFYMLVKYNLLNVLCQCIKLPTMLIEYLIDIYLLTSYLC